MTLKPLTFAGLATVVGLTLMPALGPASAAPQAPASQVTAQATQCPRVVAHRGGFETDPNQNENSMAAFKRAANMGVDVLETDVWFTKDKVAVIMHDQTLARTVQGDPPGTVGDYTFAELEQFRLKNGERIPSLEEFLVFLVERDLTGFVEYKDADDPALYRLYLDLVENSGAKVYGSGFSKDFLNWLHAEDPALPLMWFGNRSGSVPIATEPADVPQGADPGLINYLQSKELVDRFKTAGMKMNVWFNTITKGDNPTGEPNLVGQGWEGLAQFGVHWISTDFPDYYKQWTMENNTCTERAPKKSIATCVMPPKKMKAGRIYSVMLDDCMSSAAKSVKVKLKADKSVAKLVQRGDWYKVKAKNSGKAKLTFSAPERIYRCDPANPEHSCTEAVEWVSYSAYQDVNKYKVK